LCGQPESSSLDKVGLDLERQRLEAQAAETDGLIERNAGEARAAQGEVERLRSRLAEANRRLDEQTREAVTPFVDRMSDLSGQLGELRGQDEALLASLRARRELAAIEEEVQEQRRLIARLAEQIREEEGDLDIGRTRVAEVSATFEEILELLDMPWYQSARIDHESYLPVVNGGSLQELSSGGMKTMVNVAYYLANLTYAIANVDSRLPRFMIIDSPRKNFGSGTADREHAAKIYERILTLQDVAQTRVGGLARPFQLIVADNDLPERFARRLGARRVLRLSYDSPLIDDLAHPGPDVETIGS